MVPADKNEEALGKLPKDSSWILAAAGGKTVYVNQQPATDPLPRALQQDGKNIATP